jgi:hypothetical protein
MERAAPDAKRQKLVDSIILSNDFIDSELNNVTEQEQEAEAMTLEELLDVKYKQCYACEHFSADSLNENEEYLYMMKLYTQNASGLCKEAIFNLIKNYFDKYVRPHTSHDWTLECIREHFTSHTNFPTDEIVNQLAIKRALRNKLSDYLVEKRPDGTLKFNSGNIKNIIALDKEIVNLLRARKEIPSMVGYNATLDF